MTVPEIDQAATDHDSEAVSAATKAALASDVPIADVAESIVAYVEQSLLANDPGSADLVLFHAVHDGVPPHALFTEIKRMARTPKETT